MNTIFYKLAFRNLFKNKVSSAINIIGFSIGMAACLFIFLFVKYETSFDEFHPNSESIYRVVGNFTSNNGISKSGFVWYPIAEDIKNEIPGVANFCRVSEDNPAKFIVDNEIQEIEKLRYADANFFQFFNFELLSGNPKTALNGTDKIIVTEKKATQLFGDKNPLGQSIMLNHKLFTVSGIAENPPSNTQLVFDAIIPSKYIEESDLYYTGYNGGMTFLSYLELAKNTSPQQIEKALPAFFDRKINQQWQGRGMSLSGSLQNIKDVHLSDGSIGYDISTNRNKKSISIIVSINLLILLLAVINYVLLYAAQRITKSKNTGILKIFGAGNSSLIAQAYLEVFIISTLASLAGVLLLLVGGPILNTYFKTSIFIGDSIFSVVLFLLLAVVVLSFVVTFFSAKQFMVARPLASLGKTLFTDKPKKLQANFLVSFQFAVVIVLLISVVVISRQNNFLLNTELGFDKENIISIEADEEFMNDGLLKFKQDLQQLAGINSVSLSSQMVGNGITQNGYTIGDEEESSMINALYADADFLDCFKVNLLSGRNFKQNNNLDKNAILINQQLVKRAGWENPLDKTIHRDGNLSIIGVVEDFNFASLENTVQPMLIMSNPEWDDWGYSVVNIRLQTSDTQSLIAQINKLWENSFPETPFEVSFLDDVLASNYQSFIAQQKIVSFFSFIAMLIAIIGLLGLTIYTSQTRIKEIGIRKVNGATITEIMTMLNKDFIKWVVIAFVFACPVAYFAMRKWLEGFAYQTTLNWWVFALAGIVVLMVAILAVSWQSFRAAMANPVEALKEE